MNQPKHIIYYFTGTGNSLWTARELAARLDGAELLPILGTPSPEAKSVSSAATVGVVFPVYMHRPPHLVADFFRRLPSTEYLYAVVVNGGDMGRAFNQCRKVLLTGDAALAAGFDVPTPSNYLPFGEAVEGPEREELFNAAKERFDAMAGTITARTPHWDRQGDWYHSNIWPGLFYALGYKMIPTMGQSLKADESCTSCGICEQVCPVGNITMVDGAPRWNNHCEMCLACLNLCPEAAIQYGKKTAGLRRYRNPYVSVADITGQKRMTEG